MMIFYRMIFIKKKINFLIKAKINRYSCKIFWQQKIARLGLDEISTFVEGKVVKIFFGFTMLTQKNVQFILARLLYYNIPRRIYIIYI